MQIPLPGKWQTEPTVGELQNISVILSWKKPHSVAYQTGPVTPVWVMLEAKAQPTADTGGNASRALAAGSHTPRCSLASAPPAPDAQLMMCALSAVEGLCCKAGVAINQMAIRRG